MPTPTTRLALLKPTVADSFSTQDLADNWQKIDDSPGTKICTSSTRPSGWGVAQTGMEIAETDTNLKWRWDGTKFVRAAPSGLLKTTGGGWARGENITAFSTTSGSYMVAASISNVVVPDGHRTLMIIASWVRVINANGMTNLAIFRSNVDNQAPLLAGWDTSGTSVVPVRGQGGSYVTYEVDGLAPGTYNYSLQVKSLTPGVLSTISADATTPIEISVIEI